MVSQTFKIKFLSLSIQTLRLLIVTHFLSHPLSLRNSASEYTYTFDFKVNVKLFKCKDIVQITKIIREDHLRGLLYVQDKLVRF